MKIIELFIQTNQIYQTKKFYSEILEFEILKESNKSITFQIGESKLTFDVVEDEVNPNYHFAFNIPSNKIFDSKNWISKKLKLIETADFTQIVNFQNWKAKAIYFYDNNKNILEFICREDLHVNSKNEFTSKSILNISEVGIGTKNPLELANSIYEHSDVEYFLKGPKREDFVALGDEIGLFVISKSNRNWFPTNKMVEIEKLKVIFCEKDKKFSKVFNG